METGGVGLLQHRVLPPGSLGGRMAEGFLADAALNSRTYFTDLMTTDFSLASQADSNQQAENSVPKDHPSAAVKGYQKRSKNFSDNEDFTPCVSLAERDIGSNSRSRSIRSTYWKIIHNYFHGNKTFNSDCSQGSLLNHWSGIQHDVNVFAGCLSKIEARNHSS